MRKLTTTAAIALALVSVCCTSLSLTLERQASETPLTAESEADCWSPELGYYNTGDCDNE